MLGNLALLQEVGEKRREEEGAMGRERGEGRGGGRGREDWRGRVEDGQMTREIGKVSKNIIPG